MKELKIKDLQDTKGVWVIVDKSNEQLLVEDPPGGDKLTKPPYLLVFNDYQKANYFLFKSKLADSNPHWVVMSINNQSIWSNVLKKCGETKIVSGRLNTCIEDVHNCAKLIVLFDDYKDFDKLYDALRKQDYDHWTAEGYDKKDGTKLYVWDWEHVNE
ncbi:MAG: hypothetical protein NTX11_03535 [Candidatus Saccharibacteria bacterium]|nr:hypothetical protein [Candidatus Saccharibacteria bacterium]